jgi:hypothetical protein
MKRLKTALFEIEFAYYYVADYLKLCKAALEMYFAIKLADMKQRAFNRQYHVMRMETGNAERHRLICVSNRDIKAMRLKGAIPKGLGMFELSRQEWFYYSTPLSRNNAERREARLKAMARFRNYAAFERSLRGIFDKRFREKRTSMLKLNR